MEDKWTTVTYKKTKNTDKKTVQIVQNDNTVNRPHQDWEKQYLRGKPDIKTQRQQPQTFAPKKKHTNGPISFNKLMDDDSDKRMEIPKVDINVGKQIQLARTNNNITQEELAKKIGGKYGITKEIIRDIENGKAIYNGQQIATIKRFLNI